MNRRDALKTIAAGIPVLIPQEEQKIPVLQFYEQCKSLAIHPNNNADELLKNVPYESVPIIANDQVSCFKQSRIVWLNPENACLQCGTFKPFFGEVILTKITTNYYTIGRRSYAYEITKTDKSQMLVVKLPFWDKTEEYYHVS